MTRIFTLKSECFFVPLTSCYARCNHDASEAFSPRLCAQAGVVQGVVFSGSHRRVTTYAFRFTGAGESPCPIHRAARSEGMTPPYALPLFSVTALGLSVALAARRRSALASPPWQVLVPPSRAPSKKARFGLGSRALREASPGVP